MMKRLFAFLLVWIHGTSTVWSMPQVHGTCASNCDSCTYTNPSSSVAMNKKFAEGTVSQTNNTCKAHTQATCFALSGTKYFCPQNGTCIDNCANGTDCVKQPLAISGTRSAENNTCRPNSELYCGSLSPKKKYCPEGNGSCVDNCKDNCNGYHGMSSGDADFGVAGTCSNNESSSTCALSGKLKQGIDYQFSAANQIQRLVGDSWVNFYDTAMSVTSGGNACDDQDHNTEACSSCETGTGAMKGSGTLYPHVPSSTVLKITCSSNKITRFKGISSGSNAGHIQPGNWIRFKLSKGQSSATYYRIKVTSAMIEAPSGSWPSSSSHLFCPHASLSATLAGECIDGANCDNCTGFTKTPNSGEGNMCLAHSEGSCFNASGTKYFCPSQKSCIDDCTASGACTDTPRAIENTRAINNNTCRAHDQASCHTASKWYCPDTGLCLSTNCSSCSMYPLIAGGTAGPTNKTCRAGSAAICIQDSSKVYCPVDKKCYANCSSCAGYTRDPAQPATASSNTCMMETQASCAGAGGGPNWYCAFHWGSVASPAGVSTPGAFAALFAAFVGTQRV